MCITDMVQSLTDCGLAARSAGNGGVTRAWWGYEVHNVRSALGVGDALPDVPIKQPQYQRANTSTWIYTEDSTVIKIGAKPYYHVTTNQAGTGETLNGFTDLHP
jgi:hypothetical protein